LDQVRLSTWTPFLIGWSPVVPEGAVVGIKFLDGGPAATGVTLAKDLGHVALHQSPERCRGLDHVVPPLRWHATLLMVVPANGRSRPGNT
jgi:hypothetical protein